jgi:hypothetical protein
MAVRPFHLAFVVANLDATRQFYEAVLGCTVGRSAATWIDFDCFGHQISAHLGTPDGQARAHSMVDGQPVPVPHWGVILEMPQWEALAARLQQHGVRFVLPPQVRFRGQPGEQATLFLQDPSGNALEFKAFHHDAQLFAR